MFRSVLLPLNLKHSAYKPKRIDYRNLGQNTLAEDLTTKNGKKDGWVDPCVDLHLTTGVCVYVFMPLLFDIWSILMSLLPDFYGPGEAVGIGRWAVGHPCH